MTLELTKSAALKAFNEGDDRDKALLERLYGKEVFSQKITDRVKTFEDACEVLGQNPEYALSDIDTCSEDNDAIIAFAKLSIIRKALNEGWKPDYTNSSEPKYFPWFKYNAGSGFSLLAVGYDDTNSAVGARLSFKSRELAEYAGKQFADLYNVLFTL